MIDRPGLAAFLRQRRQALQPEDVGLPRGQRRRTDGLRREEAAALCHMSTDYYARLERQRGPHPSPQMIASIAQGLHLSLDERDHLFRLADHQPPPRGGESEHVSPGLLRILDRLDDTPAEVVTELGETLRQNALGTALVGDLTRFRGPARSLVYRWFTDPDTRRLYEPEDHDFSSRLYASHARAAVTLRGPASRAAQLCELLLAQSPEFRMPVRTARGRRQAPGVQAPGPPAARPAGAELPDAARPLPVTPTARVHRHARLRDARQARAAGRHRRERQPVTTCSQGGISRPW